MDITGTTVVVTGGAHGIGAAIVRAVARAGVGGVLIADLDEVGAQRIADEVAADTGVATLARRVDVADPQQVDGMVAAAERELGPVEVVVSNAGIGTGAGIDASLDAWQRSYEVNVLAHVHAARAALPGMLERGRGAFVHTASAAGLLTMIGDAPYAVTKHGAVAFAEWLSITYGSRGIQVGCLCPQGVETDLLRNGAGSVPEQVVRMTGAVLTPEQVADDVVAALDDGRFLILPHPEVADHLRRKAEDPERWIGALRRVVDQVEGRG
jgi:NAD(P)-dependent dehydrogenase (short-subunit alcohol dehydrogenase family)